jgi:hypothetical protein
MKVLVWSKARSMLRACAWGAVLLGACGRVGFDEHVNPGADGDADVPPGAVADGPAGGAADLGGEAAPPDAGAPPPGADAPAPLDAPPASPDAAPPGPDAPVPDGRPPTTDAAAPPPLPPDAAPPPPPDAAGIDATEATMTGPDATTGPAAGDWWSPTHRHRRRLEVPGTAVRGRLAGFPLLVSLVDPAMTARVQDGGADLAFVDPQTGRALPFELVALDRAAGRLLAWVRIEALEPGVANGIHLYYDAPSAAAPAAATAVWADYTAVWHLEETGAGLPTDYRDATGRGHHGRGGNGNAARIPTRAEGLIGGAQRFDGTNDFILHGADLPQAAGTLSHWLRPTEKKVAIFYYEVGGGAGYDRDGFGAVDLREVHTAVFDYGAFIRSAGGTPRNDWTWFAQIQDGPVASSPSARVWMMPDVGAELEWTHVALTWDVAGRSRLYVDGVEVHSQDLAPRRFSNFAPMFRAMGRSLDDRADRHYAGFADEVRVTPLVRGAAWLEAEARNQRDPGSFVTVGPEEPRP